MCSIACLKVSYSCTQHLVYSICISFFVHTYVIVLHMPEPRTCILLLYHESTCVEHTSYSIGGSEDR